MSFKVCYLKTRSQDYFMLRTPLLLEIVSLPGALKHTASKVEIHHKGPKIAIVFIKDSRKYWLKEQPGDPQFEDITNKDIQQHHYNFERTYVGATYFCLKTVTTTSVSYLSKSGQVATIAANPVYVEQEKV